MRKYSPLIALFACLSVALAQPYACSFDMKIGVGDLQTVKAPLVIAEGYDPAISPDGKKIAFTKYDESGNRHIAIVDAASRKSEFVSGIPGDNNYGPIWSPDGEYLYFNHFLDSDWSLARVRSSGGGFEIIHQGTVAFAIFPDGKKLLCNDMNRFFVLALKEGGNPEQNVIPVDTLRYESIAIPCRIDVAPDGKSALFEMSVGADGQGAKGDFPPISIWQVDLKTGSLIRVTPSGINATYPSWLPDGQAFLYVQDDPDRKTLSIYQKPLSLDAGTKLVVKKAAQPTVARH